TTRDWSSDVCSSDLERHEERQEKQHLRARFEDQLTIRQHLLNRRHIEGPRSVVEPDDAHQHQNRAGHGVEHKFYGGIDAPLVAPDPDQEGHGDQHQFPEEEEQEKVERQENDDHADFEQQQHDEKFLHTAP